MPVTWDSATKNANITLTNSDLTATCTTGDPGGIVVAKLNSGSISGKKYFEVTVTYSVQMSLGISGANFDNATFPSNAEGTAYNYNGDLFHFSAVNDGADGTGFASGDTILVAIDGTAGLNRVWYYAGGAWRGAVGGSDDPTTGTGGQSVSGNNLGGQIIPSVGFRLGSDAAVLNAGRSTFTNTTQVTALNSAGFSALDPGTTSYTLTASAGSFAYSGVAAGLKVGRKVTASAGSFAFTGVSAGLRAARKLTASAGSFAFSGGSGGFDLNGLLFVLGTPGTGATTNLVYGRRMVAQAGSFAFTGSNVTLAYARRMVAEAGSFALTGVDTLLTFTPRIGWITQSPLSTIWTEQFDTVNPWTTQ